jgi:hypothetical protein
MDESSGMQALAQAEYLLQRIHRQGTGAGEDSGCKLTIRQ